MELDTSGMRLDIVRDLMIYDALKRNDWARRKTADELGISRRALQNWIRKNKTRCEIKESHGSEIRRKIAASAKRDFNGCFQKAWRHEKERSCSG